MLSVSSQNTGVPLAGTEEEMELRDDPSDLKVSTGGKALALPSPKLGSLSSSLKAL